MKILCCVCGADATVAIRVVEGEEVRAILTACEEHADEVAARQIDGEA